MLRVSGKIVEGPDELIAKGSYHTFNIQKDTILKIIKEKWSSIELQRLKDAENSSLRSKILVVILDDRDATIALLRESKVFYYDLTSKSISGKYYKDLKDYYIASYAEVNDNAIPLIIILSFLLNNFHFPLVIFIGSYFRYTFFNFLPR